METYDLAIIGTGSDNTILDDRYAGRRVAICEQDTFGGTCLNVGCIPTKMFVYAAEVAATIRGAARYGVDAHVDGVRWDDIVSRIFGRIDPIGVSGEDGRVVVDEYQRTSARGIFALGDVPSSFSSSTSPTTRPVWCGTTCCATGTTPIRWRSPTIDTCRPRCSQILRSRASV